MSEEASRVMDRRSQAGESNILVPVMVVLFLVVAGALWWFGRAAQEEEAAPVAEAPVVEAPVDPAFTEVTADQLKTDAGQFVGQQVRVSNIGVATAVGSQAFFLDVTQSPFLVKLSDSLVAAGQAVPTGMVTVEGTMMAMSDSIIQDWLAKNLITADQQPIVEFALHFIEASSVQQAP